LPNATDTFNSEDWEEYHDDPLDTTKLACTVFAQLGVWVSAVDICGTGADAGTWRELRVGQT
jgi:hypothetical protein